MQPDGGAGHLLLAAFVQVAAKMIRRELFPRRKIRRFAELFEGMPIVRERPRRDIALDFEVLKKAVGDAIALRAFQGGANLPDARAAGELADGGNDEWRCRARWTRVSRGVRSIDAGGRAGFLPRKRRSASLHAPSAPEFSRWNEDLRFEEARGGGLGSSRAFSSVCGGQAAGTPLLHALLFPDEGRQFRRLGGVVHFAALVGAADEA